MQLRTIFVLQSTKAPLKCSAISTPSAEAIFVHKEYDLERVLLMAYMSLNLLQDADNHSQVVIPSWQKWELLQWLTGSIKATRLKKEKKTQLQCPQAQDTDMLRFVIPKAPPSTHTRIYHIPLCIYFTKPSLQFLPVYRKEELHTKNAHDISK